jgi:hypothetical protein
MKKPFIISGLLSLVILFTYYLFIFNIFDTSFFRLILPVIIGVLISAFFLKIKKKEIASGILFALIGIVILGLILFLVWVAYVVWRGLIFF